MMSWKHVIVLLNWLKVDLVIHTKINTAEWIGGAVGSLKGKKLGHVHIWEGRQILCFYSSVDFFVAIEVYLL